MKIRKVITIFGRKHLRVKLIQVLGNAEVVCESYSINKKGDQIISPLTRRRNETPERFNIVVFLYLLRQVPYIIRLAKLHGFLRELLKFRYLPKEWASKFAESDKRFLFFYNQEKLLKDDKASEKPIETTAESSFTSFLASGASSF